MARTRDGIERLRYLVLAAQREGSRSLAYGLSSLNLTPSQAEVLRLLADHGPMSLTGLGQLLVCESGTNPSRLVTRLVEAGLVSRAGAADDARQVVLSLTETGVAQAARVLEVERHLHDTMRATLAQTPTGPLIAALETLIHGTPAAEAISRRFPADDRGDEQ